MRRDSSASAWSCQCAEPTSANSAQARSACERAVRASSVEVYGADAVPPAGAVVHFYGVDRDAGPLVRYSLLHEASRDAA